VSETVAVCVPTIPPRLNTLLPLALASVYAQLRVVDAVSVAVDVHHDGAWKTRQRAVDATITDWVAFLDDDDVLKPQHVLRLLETAHATGGDFIFSYFDTTVTPDLLGNFGRPFDHANPHHTTMTVMVRAELAKMVRFTPRLPEHEAGGEDWRFILGCVDAGAKMVHLPEQTWIWRHHAGNTSGREDRW
jgi:glycosyltransferase involved in cell wall biosynthesis